MSRRTAVYPTPEPNKLLPSIGRVIATHRLARHIETAHESGVLFFLAAHLKPLLEDFCTKNGQSTTAELEKLVAEAAKAMASKN